MFNRFMLLVLLVFPAAVLSVEPADTWSRAVPSPTHANNEEANLAVLQRARKTSERLRKEQGKSALALDHSVDLKWPVRKSVNFPDPHLQVISNYLDQDTTQGNLLDWNCGARTYDGHNGVDIGMAPFSWRSQDKDHGIVIAAAGGIILEKVGDQPDQSCTFDTSDGTNNLVIIEHADGSYGIYAHMRTDSLTRKKVGDSVQTGEYLGVIGSAGISTGPHLHLSVGFWEGNTFVYQDPWAGSCNAINTQGWWETQPPDRLPALMAVSTHSAWPDIPPCPGIEEPHFQENYEGGDTAFFLVTLRDTAPEHFLNMEVRTPGNAMYTQLQPGLQDTPGGLWTGFSVPLPMDTPGEWTFKVEFEGETITKSFWVDATKPKKPPVPVANNAYNGLWFSAAFDGEGYNFVTTKNGTVIFFYGNTEDGRRMWLISDTFRDTLVDGKPFEVVMKASSGGVWDSPIESRRGLEVWGTLTLTFETCKKGTATLVGRDGHQVSNIRKLTASPGTNCQDTEFEDTSTYSGIWFDPGQEGQGFNYLHTKIGTFFTFYGFAKNGDNIWFLAGPAKNFGFGDGEEITLNLRGATSGSFGAPAPPGDMIEWGTMKITGSTCKRMIVELDTLEGVKVLDTRRLASVLGLECP